MPDCTVGQRRNPVIVLIQAMDLSAIQALRYAMNLSQDIVAFSVTTNENDEAALHASWHTVSSCIPLITRIVPDGGIVNPLLGFIKSSWSGCTSDGMVTVILPQMVISNKWQRLQQYSISKYLERKLARHPNIVTVVLPVHIPDADAANLYLG